MPDMTVEVSKLKLQFSLSGYFKLYIIYGSLKETEAAQR